MRPLYREIFPVKSLIMMALAKQYFSRNMLALLVNLCVFLWLRINQFYSIRTLQG